MIESGHRPPLPPRQSLRSTRLRRGKATRMTDESKPTASSARIMLAPRTAWTRRLMARRGSSRAAPRASERRIQESGLRSGTLGVSGSMPRPTRPSNRVWRWSTVVLRRIGPFAAFDQAERSLEIAGDGDRPCSGTGRPTVAQRLRDAVPSDRPRESSAAAIGSAQAGTVAPPTSDVKSYSNGSRKGPDSLTLIGPDSDD